MVRSNPMSYETKKIKKIILRIRINHITTCARTMAVDHCKYTYDYSIVYDLSPYRIKQIQSNLN